MARFEKLFYFYSQKPIVLKSSKLRVTKNLHHHKRKKFPQWQLSLFNLKNRVSYSI